MWWNEPKRGRLLHCSYRKKWTLVFFVSSCHMCDVEVSGSTSCPSLLRDSIESTALYSNGNSTTWSHPIFRCVMWLPNNPLSCCSLFPASSSIDYRLCQLWWPDMLMTFSLCICSPRFLLKGQNLLAKCRKSTIVNERLLQDQYEWLDLPEVVTFCIQGQFSGGTLHVHVTLSYSLLPHVCMMWRVDTRAEHIMVTMSPLSLSLCASISSLSFLRAV